MNNMDDSSCTFNISSISYSLSFNAFKIDRIIDDIDVKAFILFKMAFRWP
jgi:hypothetical protein